MAAKFGLSWTRCLVGTVVALVGGANSGWAQAPAAISDVHYDVTFDASTAASRTVQVAMSFRAGGNEPVRLSLPAWTPGSYELDNFARNISNFTASTDSGPVKWDMTDYDTWRVYPARGQTITVSFDYRADTLDTGMSWTAPDFAFFNGTNLFLYPDGGSLEFPARVTIHTDAAWRVATGMTSAGPGEFVADTYHDVVDMPTFVGRFDIDSAQVGQQWYRLATYPAGVLSGAARAKLWDDSRKMMPPMAAVFGEVPWNTYTIQIVFDDDYPGASALEHQNSHLGIYVTAAIGSPFLPAVVAHEVYHAWNVKRLRPAELVPYDYGRAQPTPLLWVSEGITDYYADLALVRGGVASKQAFYQRTSGKVQSEANSPPIALEDASLSTWIEPRDGTAFIYYDKGSVAGLLLDILIRDASDNRSSLDDVMSELYRTTYKAGAGFTTDQWWDAVSRSAGGKSFADFHERYIDGRERFPWRDVLPLAGLTLGVDSTRAPWIGVSLGQDNEGVKIMATVPDGMAAKAGVQTGDYLLRVGEIEAGTPMSRYRERYAREPVGTLIEIVVRRGTETLTLQGGLQHRTRVVHSLGEDAAATPKAVRIRNGILQGQVDR
jgi:predicted metalloprotease with PDZ domain